MIEFGIFMIAAFISGFFCGLKLKKEKARAENEERDWKESLIESIKDFIEDYIPGKEPETSEVKKVITKDGKEKDARYFF
jgi:Mn-dependent DtxR family transcriptional regulator